MFKKYRSLIGVLSLCAFFAGCEVEQTREARLPDVDVDVDATEGQMPAYEIDGPDVNVGVQEKSVSVPKIRFETEREEISVPYIDIDMPGDADDMDREERELAVEFDVDQGVYDVEIEQIRARGDELYVIARLDEVDGAAEGAARVSDRVLLKAPDAKVRYYVIGNRPAGSAAGRYTFVSNEASLPDHVRDAKVIYRG